MQPDRRSKRSTVAVYGSCQPDRAKTVAFSTLAAQLDWPTLILVHRKELASQAAQELRTRWPGVEIGFLPGNDWKSAHVVIATVQSMRRRLHEFAPDHFGLIVVDEAHHAPAKSWRAILDHFRPEFVLGCTATPMRLDGQDVKGYFGGVIYQYRLTQAMNDGYVVPVRQYGILTNVSLAEVPVGRDFTIKRLASVVRSKERTQRVVKAYLEHKDRPALFFAVDLEHADELQQELVRQGVKAAVVNGKMKSKDRERILKDFSEGRLDVLVSCEVLTEGYDERRVSCVVMARPTASKSFYYQCIGRGIRMDLETGKKDCLVLDVIDRGARKYPIVASDLFGARVPDCQGEDIRMAAERERDRWDLHPVSPSASLQADWDLGKETRWEELPNLEEYVPTRWHQEKASDRQIRKLTHFYRLGVHRDLTTGEASYLIDDCKELEEEYHTPATSGQEYFLRALGDWIPGMSKHEARRRTGEHFSTKA